MKKLLTKALVIIALPVSIFAAGEDNISLSKVFIDIHNEDATKRGAQFFSQNCASCHTMDYLTLDPIAEAAGITPDNKPDPGYIMTLEGLPPDLTLITRIRGVNWVYTFLNSFYADESSSTGSNNLLLENTSMPNLLQAQQGRQQLRSDVNLDFIDEFNFFGRKPKWFDLLIRTNEGTVSAGEFDRNLNDLMHFLVYAAEPTRAKRESIGWWVLGFLTLFIIVTYRLKKEYWKDIKPNIK